MGNPKIRENLTGSTRLPRSKENNSWQAQGHVWARWQGVCGQRNKVWKAKSWLKSWSLINALSSFPLSEPSLKELHTSRAPLGLSHRPTETTEYKRIKNPVLGRSKKFQHISVKMVKTCMYCINLHNHPFNIFWEFLTLIGLRQDLQISFSIKGSWLSLLEIRVLPFCQQFKTDMILHSLVLEHELPNCLQMCHMNVMLRQRWHQNAQMLCPVLSLIPF